MVLFPTMVTLFLLRLPVKPVRQLSSYWHTGTLVNWSTTKYLKELINILK
jgi:hypothetical protein